MAFYEQLLEEYELGWRAAGALVRENQGAGWMRLVMIQHRCYTRGDYGGAGSEWHEPRPTHTVL